MIGVDITKHGIHWANFDSHDGQCEQVGFEMARTRLLNDENPDRLQRAIAEFPLMVASMAADMKKLIGLRDTVGATPELEECIRLYEAKIRDCYSELFGTHIGNQPPPEYSPIKPINFPKISQ